MKTKNLTLLPVFLLLATTVILSSCGGDDIETAEPAITAVSPETGVEGATVTITGHHFGETPAENEVKFNGTAATVTSASHSEIVTTVPVGATTGKITVTVGGTVLTSPNNFVVIDPITITSVDPMQGVAGTIVVISGTNFSSTAAQNVVKFGSNAIAEIIDASSTELVVEVPEAATTGAISITVNGSTTTTANNFTILVPTITSVDPVIGGEGLSIVIKGTNFSTYEDYNKVKFNTAVATVAAATSTEITVPVPQGATTGKITVKVGPNTATSITDFTVCNDSELAIISGEAVMAGASVNYKFTLFNYGKETIDLNQWSYQNYASVNQVYDPGDAGGGGAILDGNGTIATGQSKEIVSSVGLNAAPYSYFIFTISADVGVNECLTNNNTLTVPIQK